MSAEFDIATRTEGDVVVVAPKGDLDAGTSQVLAETLETVIGAEESCRGIVLDFSEVASCDSRCIGVLLASYRYARDRGIGLVVASSQGMVRRLLMIAGIDQVIALEEDVARAVAGMRAAEAPR
ncbi:MAG: STAS domain-containing protein [Thermobifida fusca]|uniref:STAS domain-containing protein n=1 Tax=Thermobifida TaxID=83677 RepID=UPI0003A0ED8A|nr:MULTISPECIES: STAS domain-containing protein [Thermobifida]MBO2529806.1 anti-sigma factor antagonist [Thermobifida sp.]MDD6793265.1 STAS domain-containing protein [Thermobifida fusca]PPS95487.1 anti-sigma factor antagonist [Thermobifida fusca]PZN61435.1 MAG: anti-sigma factor antagonist [Thermobifida fusca]